jgi:hypothetical protein
MCLTKPVPPSRQHVHNGAVEGARCSRRCLTRVAVEETGQQKGLPLLPSPITLLRTQFFRVVKVQATKAALHLHTCKTQSQAQARTQHDRACRCRSFVTASQDSTTASRDFLTTSIKTCLETFFDHHMSAGGSDRCAAHKFKMRL